MTRAAILSLFLCAALALGACAPTNRSAGAATPADAASTAPATATPEAAKPPAEAPPAAPPQRVALPEQLVAAEADLEWLIDENGVEYTVHPYPKSGGHLRLADGRLRIPGGGEFVVLGETESEFELKVPRAARGGERIDRRAAHLVPPTEEALAAVAATYPGAAPASERLTLARFDRGLPERGQWRNGFDLVDMNGDGEIDFVHGPPRKGGDQIRIYLGDGAGGWTPMSTTTSPPGVVDYGDVRAADLDGDQDLDLAMAIHLRGVAVLLNDGKGNFTVQPEGQGLDFKVPTIGEPAATFSSRRIEVVDWNRDGRLDLVAYSEGPTSTRGPAKTSSPEANQVKPAAMSGRRGPRIYLNQGNSRWQVQPTPAGASDLFGDDFEIADMNGDQLYDLFLGTNFMAKRELVFFGTNDDANMRAQALDLRPRAYARAVAQGDWNGDGRIDLALSYQSYELRVTRVGVDLFLGGEGGAFERRPVYSQVDGFALVTLDGGDIDGDGAEDLVGLDRDGAMLLLLGKGDGTFLAETSPESQQPRGKCRGYALRTADLNGDGADEIVATYADEPVPLYEPNRCTGYGGVAIFSAARSN